MFYEKCCLWTPSWTDSHQASTHSFVKPVRTICVVLIFIFWREKLNAAHHVSKVETTCDLSVDFWMQRSGFDQTKTQNAPTDVLRSDLPIASLVPA